MRVSEWVGVLFILASCAVFDYSKHAIDLCPINLFSEHPW